MSKEKYYLYVEQYEYNHIEVFELEETRQLKDRIVEIKNGVVDGAKIGRLIKGKELVLRPIFSDVEFVEVL